VSYLADFVGVCDGEYVGIDRSWAGDSHADVTLINFRCKRVKIALTKPLASAWCLIYIRQQLAYT